MKITMNGVVLEDVTATEALQLMSSLNKQTKTEQPILVNLKTITKKRKPSCVKPSRGMIWWTEDEIKYILSNPTLKPKDLQKNISRHSIQAVSVMSSAIRSGRPEKAGKYVRKIMNQFHNQGISKPITIPVKTANYGKTL